MTAVNSLIQDWLPESESLEPFYKGIDKFLEEYLINEKLQGEDGDDPQPKIIADPLLGYIHFSELEVAIIDTKLFQRLRKIRQLGLAHLVFPSLGYSRFEHSLGVVGRLNQVLNKLIENNTRFRREDGIKGVIDKYAVPLRLAALLHDIGHCLFSHCSERVVVKASGIAHYPSAKDIQDAFSRHFEKDSPIPFAEIFAVSFVGSKRFLRFIEHYGNLGKAQTKETLLLAGRFILGLPYKEDPDTVFLAQLISSGLDADKIDYMNREQHYSGIKLEIDLDRILSKLHVFDLTAAELPKNLDFVKRMFTRDLRGTREPSFKVLGFEKGGQFAFEEFCVARLALNVKIYLHQKVRGAESQLSKYLDLISQHPLLQEAHNWLKLPEAIIEYPDLIFNRLRDLSGMPLLDSGYAQGIQHEIENINFKKIDDRELYYRAFAFGPINNLSERTDFRPSDEIGQLQEIKNFFDDYKEKLSATDIVAEVKEVARHSGEFLDEKYLNEIVIDLPRLISIQQGQESVHFDRPQLIPLKWTIPIDKIVVYFQENRALGFVYAPKEIAHVVSVAAEKVVFNAFAKTFSQDGYISKTTYDRVSRLKSKLERNKYYDNLPSLRQVSDYLKSSEAAEKMESILDRLRKFRSVANDEAVTIERIMTFVNQFPHELQNACLAFLEHFTLYEEGILEADLRNTLEKAKRSGEKVALCPLGARVDSGGKLEYRYRDIYEEFMLDSVGVSESVVLSHDRLILYDDNINSGRQLVNMFADLLGADKSKLGSLALTEEKHFDPLSEQGKTRLLGMPIDVLFIVGTEAADEIARENLRNLLEMDGSRVSVSVNTVLRKDERIFSGKDSKFQHEDKLKLRRFMEEVGEELLRNEGKSEEKVETCKLGYSNAEAMVLFPYNVPTMTITALWCKGVYKGHPWVPLTERRRRTNKEGVFVGED